MCRSNLHLRISTVCRERRHPRGRGTSGCKDPDSGVEEDGGRTGLIGDEVYREWRRRECRGGVCLKETEEGGLRGVGGGEEEVNVEGEEEGSDVTDPGGESEV